jgi:uncharacterized membrane protein
MLLIIYASVAVIIFTIGVFLEGRHSTWGYDKIIMGGMVGMFWPLLLAVAIPTLIFWSIYKLGELSRA